MEVVSIIITLVALIATVVFGYLQIVVPFIKKEVRLSRKFPYIESTDIPTKRRRKRKKKRSRWLIPITAVAVVLVAIILLRVLLLQAAELPRKPIAVMQFKNLTGDAQYDYLCEAIPNLLITNLEQSERLQVMTWERMHDLLKQLDKEDIEIIDEETGFELCRLDDVNTIITGSFTKMGDLFVTDIKILDVSSKKLLKTANSKGEGVASILKVQVDDLSRDIAKNVSLFERTVAPTQMEVIEVTTSSMEAYNYFLRGRDEWDRKNYDVALRFLEKAIELDTNFVSAYLYLARTYRDLGINEACNKTLKKAKTLVHKATEREKLWIEALYAIHFEGDIERSVHNIAQLLKKFPQDILAHCYMGKYYEGEKKLDRAITEYNTVLKLDPKSEFALWSLGYIYAELAEYEKAIEYFQLYATVSPGDADPFDCLGDLYFRMGQFDEAQAKYKDAIFAKPSYSYSIHKIAYTYALSENYDKARDWIDQSITNAISSGIKAGGYRHRAFYNCLLGNFNQALSDLSIARSLLEPNELEYDTIHINRVRGWVYYDMRRFELSREYFVIGFDKNPSYCDSAMCVIKYNFPLGLVDVMQGNLDSARVRLAIIKTLLPYVVPGSHDDMQLFHDFLHAEILLAEDSLEDAIALGGVLSKQVIDDANSTYWYHTINILQNLAARIYLKKDDIENAILEYERLTDFDPNNRGRCLIRPLWRYELAKLYEEKGLNDKAIEQYEKFLDLWKDADDDLPEPHDARKRLARLKANN